MYPSYETKQSKRSPGTERQNLPQEGFADVKKEAMDYLGKSMPAEDNAGHLLGGKVNGMLLEQQREH
jgi:hypothetical protein